MKKIIAFFFSLIFTFFFILNTNASEKEKELENLKNDAIRLMYAHKRPTLFSTKYQMNFLPHEKTFDMEKVKEYEAALKKYLTAKGNVIHKENLFYKNNKGETINVLSNKKMISSWDRSAGGNLINYTFNAGDILIFKLKDPPLWSRIFSDSYNHGILVLDNNITIEAPGPSYKSQISSLHRYVNDDSIEEIILVKRWLFDEQREELVRYAKNNLLNKPYPERTKIPWAKKDTHQFYCTSLIWRAHKSSGEYIDLDGDTSTVFDIVYPLDLTRNPQIFDDIYIIK